MQLVSTHSKETDTQPREGCHLRKYDTLGTVFSYERMLMARWRPSAIPPQGEAVFKGKWLYKP